MESLCRLPVEVELGSEFRYRDPLVDRHTLLIPISQSGETADTRAGLSAGKLLGAKSLAIVNAVGSSIARDADAVLYTHAGPEIGVASTKAFTTQLVALYLIALFLAQRLGKLSRDDIRPRLTALLKLPTWVQETLDLDQEIREIGRRYMNAHNFLYLGRGIHYPIALEGALKLKEISYIHAEGYAAGEMKHGPIALLEDGSPVLVVAPDSQVYEKLMSNLQEVKARGARVIAVASAGNETIAQAADDVLYVPRTDEMLSPLLAIVPLQLFAYYVAKSRGEKVDQPRNLAKTVTVE
jgi:glucosamine--fructose-6-phosphate aminotransferase (isomerizing)